MLTEVILIGVAGFTLMYYIIHKKMSYFRRHGIAEDPGYFPFGSNPMWGLMKGKISFVDLFRNQYQKFAGERFYGYYGFFGSPLLVVNDMELVKDVLIKDFDHFVDRREVNLGKNIYLDKMLTRLSGDKWKTMRAIMSPMFTSGKLKGMVQLIDKIGDQMVVELDKIVGEDLEIKDFFQKFSMDVVASTGFGFDANAISDPNSPFPDYMDRLLRKGKYQRSMLEVTMLMMYVFVPFMKYIYTANFMDHKAMNFLTSIIKQQLDERKRTGKSRNDFIDVMLQGFNNVVHEMPEDCNQFEKDAKLEVKSKVNFTKQELETAIVANGFLSFFAGFETSSNTMASTAFFLAKNQEAQNKLYEEIKATLEAREMNQHLDYNSIQSLPYLEGCINESLRMYSLTNLERRCVKDYKVKGTDFVVKKDMMVQIPSISMMMDPKYWDNPEKFNPDRFSKEAEAERGPYHFFSFGHGPRNCIGKRFALLQTKIAIFRLIANYKVITCSKTVDELIRDPRTNQVKGGLWVKCIKREY